MVRDIMKIASEYAGSEFADFMDEVLSVANVSGVTHIKVKVYDAYNIDTYSSDAARPENKDGYILTVMFPVHIWHATFLRAFATVENDVLTDGMCVELKAYVNSYGNAKDDEYVTMNTAKTIANSEPKVIDTTKPIPTDDVRQLIDVAMNRDDKEIYIYISKDATTITISPKRDELTTCKETLCENAHKVMAQEHFEKLIREFVFNNKEGE